MQHPLIQRLGARYRQLAAALERFAAPVFLLAVRICWGFQFAQTGLGKLRNHDAVAAWFGEELGIPLPGLNAWMAAGTECAGGVLLLIGLGGRLVSVPLAFTMVVAFLTADREALAGLGWTEWDSVLEAAPFLFLFAALIVLVFGPGPISVDGWLDRAWRRAHPERP